MDFKLDSRSIREYNSEIGEEKMTHQDWHTISWYITVTMITVVIVTVIIATVIAAYQKLFG